MSRVFGIAVACLALAACTSQRETTTSRTATEQLLLSAAAERAAEAVARDVPPGRKTFVLADNFEATDGKQAIGAIRAAILARGAALVNDQAQADQIVEIRSGALGIDNSDTIVGMRQSEVPIPLTQGGITIPKIALFEKIRQLGIAKFAIAVYDARTGAAIAAPEPKFGYARKNDYTAALVISWKRDDIYEPESAAADTLELETNASDSWNQLVQPTPGPGEPDPAVRNPETAKDIPATLPTDVLPPRAETVQP